MSLLLAHALHTAFVGPGMREEARGQMNLAPGRASITVFGDDLNVPQSLVKVTWLPSSIDF